MDKLCMEQVNKMAADCIDVIKRELPGLSQIEEDRLFDKLSETLEVFFGYPDYARYR